MKKVTFRFTIIGLAFLFIFGLFMLGNKTEIIKPVISAQPINVLLLVSDQVSQNTDSIMILNYKPVTAQISLLSIPRDTKVLYDGDYIKINSAFWRGKESGSVKTGANTVISCVNQLMDIPINYYAILNLKCVQSVVDALGGVDYYIPFHMKYTAKSQNLYIDIPEGQRHLSGKEVIQLLRFRHPNGPLTKEVLHEMQGLYDGGDATRVDNNQKFLKEFFKQKAKPEILLDLNKMNQVLKIILDNTDTNLKLSECMNYVNDLPKLTKGKIRTYRMLGVDELPNWYYVFNGTLRDNVLNKTVNAEKAISKYFGLKEEVLSPSPSP